MRSEGEINCDASKAVFEAFAIATAVLISLDEDDAICRGYSTTEYDVKLTILYQTERDYVVASFEDLSNSDS